MKAHLLFLGVFFYSVFPGFAQPCKVKAYSTRNEICAGDSIQLYATGGCALVFWEDFNSVFLPSTLTYSGTPNLGNTCGAGIDNSPYLWMGSNTTSPRSVSTQAYNLVLSGACKICFDMKYGVQGQASPCEGPDQANEGVTLQYSTNGGISWTDLQYWSPNGGFDSLMTTWQTRCVNIPGAAMTTQTRFRWIQNAAMAAGSGHWGIDNIQVYCSSNVSYSWSSGHSGSSTPWLKPLATTVYTVTLTNVSTSLTYTDTVSVNVKFTPSSNFTVVSPVCRNQNSTITYTGNAGLGANFNWVFPPGGTVTGSGAGPYQVSWPSSGDYDVTLIVEQGGCQSDKVSNEVLVEPLISFFVDKFNGCEPLSIHIDDNSTPDSASFQWNFHDPGSGAANYSTLPNPNHTYSTNGSFHLTVIVSTTNGCIDTLFVPDLISVYPLPIPDFNPLPPIAPLSNPVIQFVNLSQNGSLWSWNFDDPGSGLNNSSTQKDPTHVFGEGTFQVQLVASNAFGCTDSIVKEVRIIDDLLVVPNVITPNADGINDAFVIDNLEAVTEGSLVIFNRYGKMVYQSNSYANDFDASGLSDGVYYYIFEYSTYFGKGRKSGTLTIFHQ
jgi:gliding motility-associated-like protein